MIKRMIRPKEVRHILGIGKTKYHDDIKAGIIPKPVPLGKRAVGHPEEEIEALRAAMINNRSMEAA